MSTMTRLVDYFAVVGYEATSPVTGDERADGRAKIIQRFPLDDQHLQLANQFDANIQCFCQPHKGWHLTGRQESPTFLVSVLTDVTGQRKYLACLTFLEPFAGPRAHTSDDDDDEGGGGGGGSGSRERPIEPSRLYAAKSLVVISRLDYADLFKSLLSLVYACYVDKRDNGDNKLLEQMIGRLLTVQVGGPGTAVCSHFSLGADDKHMVQSEASVHVPASGCCVYRLLADVGVGNLINLVCAILADFKVLFFSRSYTKLYEACRALDSLLFPLKYTGVYVPVLPCFGSFLEFPAAPTPYIIGVHSSFRCLLEQMHHESLGECVKVDLDSGLVHTPGPVADLIEPRDHADHSSTGLPVHLYESTLNLLYWIVKRDLLHPDELSSLSSHSSHSSHSSTHHADAQFDHVHTDKMIRAVFVRLFAQLFAGYRYCLLVVRINPRPVICFDKASFLSNHDLLANEFMNKVLDSMSFQRFIEDRAPSYRNCDVFDDLYACVQADLCAELAAHDTDLDATNSSYYSSSTSLIYTHLSRIANQLLKYEFPCYKRANDTTTATLYAHLVNNPVRSYSKFKPATEHAYKRVHSEPFPLLDAALVLKHTKHRQQSNPNPSSNPNPNPSLGLGLGLGLAQHHHQQQQQADSAHHMSKSSVVPYGPPIQTVHNICLIGKRLLDIEHKIALLNGRHVHDDFVARKLHTVQTFVRHVFDKNFKEARKHVNSTLRALRNDHARLHLCTTLEAYVRKNHVILDNEQFEYVCQLLNEALHNDTRRIHIAYFVLPLSSAFYRKLNNNTIDQCVYTRIQHHDVWSNMSFWQMAFYTDVQRSIRPVYLSNEEFAAEQAQQAEQTDAHTTLADSHTNALHFRPSEKTALEICGEQMEKWPLLDDDERDAFVRNEQGIVRSHVLHYITQMVNMKIPLDINERTQSVDTTHNLSCNGSESSLPLLAQEPSAEAAYKFIGKFVDRVCMEGCLSEEQKSSLHQNLCDVIRMQVEMLDAVCTHSKLVPLRHKPKMEQLRPEWLLQGEQVLEPGPLRCYLVPDGRPHVLVPAEGALFLTNYRLIYRGVPLNDAADLTVTRSFPIAALLKDKRLATTYTPLHFSNSVLVNGVQMRSSTFQLCNIFFDECVSAELIDKFRSTLVKHKCPASVYDVFSATKCVSATVMCKKDAVKADTFRTFAKSTLRKAGLMATKANKAAAAATTANRTPETGRKSTGQKSAEHELSEPDESLDSLSVIDENIDSAHVLKMVECSLAYCDYVRQGLVNEQTAELRICTLNLAYQLAKSLPCLFLVPRHTSDECVRKNAKCHRQNRLPVLVWKHARLNSVVLRGSAFHAKGFLGALIKTSSANTAAHHLEIKDSQINNSSMDQDKYMNEILKLTSLEHESSAANAYPCTPLTHRRSLFASKFDKAVKTIKNNYAFASSHQNSNPVHAASHTTHLPNNGNNKFNTISSSYHVNKLHMKNFNLNYNSSFDSPSNQDNQLVVDANLNDSFNSSFNSGHNARLNSNVSNASSAKYFNGIDGSRNIQPAPLYIICEKNQVKSLRNDWNKETSRYVFIPVDIHDVKETKNSFKKLCRACIPSHSVAETGESTSNPGHKVPSASFGLNRLTSSNKISRKKTSFNEPNHALNSNSFLKQIHESKWFDQIQLVLSIANTIVEKIEESSSVMVCLEDGWDLTAQVVSLAELLLDPFYRTIDGFSLLVEREWLSMGHRFTRRNNHTADDQTGFAPIFIQFLDCVHQCLSQYPNAFEFNYFYLEFLAYHSVSNRFSTFLLDNEFERAQYGLLKAEPIKRTFSAERTHVTYRQYKQLSSDTKCIWDYILKVHYNSARFFNFNYQPGVFSLSALRPGSEIYKLKLWKYYVKDDLCTGPLYDYDLINTGSYLNSNGDTWYPVCVLSAGDYCEQLNELLPSQYEVLLKQIIVKYKMQRFESDCESDVNVYISSVLNKSSEEIDAAKEGFRINWKNLWDYFFDLAERKMLNDLLIEDDIGDYGSCFMSVTKPYLTSVDETNTSQLQMAHNKHLTLMSSHSHSSGHSASTNYSTSTSSATSSTPPFPNFKKSSSKPHEFEFFVFSGVNICNLCNSNFKSNTEFIGLKCRNCNINCHEQCRQDYQLARSAILSECYGSDTTDQLRNTAPITVLVDNQFESSSYSVHTNTSTSSSSCSTTPNSHYSQDYFNKINHRTKPNLLHQYSIGNEGKMDADIGSACAIGLQYKDTTNTLVDANNKSFERKEEETILREEKSDYNYMNWSGGSQNGSPNNEHQTYAGYLKKQGALFKQWKERYFVLDSVKHQMRYYDSVSDLQTPKGVIDLSDVESINQGISSALMHQQSSEKKMVNFSNLISEFSDTNSKNCFELKTSKRIYYFLAKSPQDAYKWVKQLEMCCLDS